MSRMKSGYEALQQALSGTVKAVTRTARFEIASANVDDIEAPEDIDEFYDTYKSTAIVRSNLDTFVSDVTEPGVRVVADNDATEEFFMGGDGLPDDMPDSGFVENCFIHAGEHNQPFLPGLKTSVLNRWVRGTVMVELVKRDSDDVDSDIVALYHIRPETVTAQVKPNTNRLIQPEEDIGEDAATTEAGENAAYIQFDDQSILGRRLGRDGFSQDDIKFSTNEIVKQVLNPNIGGDETDEEGIFGTSIIESISKDVTEYNEIKRDRATAIKTKAYGLWDASFDKEVHEIGDRVEVTEWSTQDQEDWLSEVNGIDPGDIIGHDGSIDLQRFPSDVPDLDGVLDHYVDDITAPLPAPKYAVGFEKNINQFISQQQENRYEKLINEERRYQERSWTQAFRKVAESWGLDTEGLRVLIEPEEEESPIMSLDTETIDKMRTYTQSLKDSYGSGTVPSFIDEEQLATQVYQLPEDALVETDGGDLTLENMADMAEEQGQPPTEDGDGEETDDEPEPPEGEGGEANDE